MIFGILNITADSFSDGGKYLDPAAAIAHGKALMAEGADALDIGAASSNPDAARVPPEVEMARLEAVLPALSGIPISIDTYSVPVQRWALAQGVAYLNDIEGFAEPSLYLKLAASDAKLIVMHSVQVRGQATRVHVPADAIMELVIRFFDERVTVLERAGIARDRLILDPGMGYFLGSDGEASFTVLRNLPNLKARYGLPVLVSVSRKSFLRNLVKKTPLDSGTASLTAELFALRQGADYIRTHAPGALREALAVTDALTGPAAG